MLRALKNRITWYLTWRFISQMKRRGSSGVFSVICLTGIALTVFVFFAVDSIVLGYQGHIRQTLMGFQSPLKMVATNLSEHEEQGRALKQWIHDAHSPLILTEFREFYALLRLEGEDQTLGVKVRTLAKNSSSMWGEQTRFAWLNGQDFQQFEQNDFGLIMGQNLALKIDTASSIEDEILELVHPFADLGPTGEFEPQSAFFELSGFVQTGTHAIDEYYVFVNDQALAQYPQNAPYKWIWQIDDVDKSEKNLRQLHTEWPKWASSHKPLVSWASENKTLVTLMRIEKIVITILFLMLFLITTTNLSNLTHVFGMTHLKSVMILKSMGISTAQTHAIFLQFGFIMGFLGALVGLAMGSLFVFVLKVFPFPLPETYGFLHLPIVFPVNTFFALLIGVPLFCVVLSIWPARKTLQQAVVDVLRKV